MTLDCLTKIIALSARRDRSRVNSQEEHPFIGSHFGLWNGRTPDEEASGLSISCGLVSRYLTNAVVLDIPRVLTAADHDESVLYDQSVGLFRSVVSAFANAWDPDWAAIFDVKNKNGVGPFLDRMLYVSEREWKRQSFVEPTSARSEPFGDGLMYVPQDHMKSGHRS
jgi:hypothetical protein